MLRTGVMLEKGNKIAYVCKGIISSTPIPNPVSSHNSLTAVCFTLSSPFSGWPFGKHQNVLPTVEVFLMFEEALLSAKFGALGIRRVF